MTAGSEPVLCYVDRPWIYFTTRPLSEQWGDDWDDAPYEHNAGEPYTYPGEGCVLPPWRITTIAYDADLLTPADSALDNSAYSVRAINAGAVPWLRSSGYGGPPAGAVQLWAGMGYRTVCAAILESGGMVYLPVGPESQDGTWPKPTQGGNR